MTVDEQINRWLSRYENRDDIPPHHMAFARSLVAFARTHQVIPEVRPLSLWGFGDAMQFFRHPEGGWWIALMDLLDPTGVPFVELTGLFQESRREYGDLEAAFMAGPSGDPVEMVTHSFAMRVFASHSPWARVFYENTVDLLGHALERSGSTALPPMVGEDAAVQRAMRGPVIPEEW